MDKKDLNETKELSLAGKITFPEAVKRMIANNIERYIADLAELKITYFSNDGESYESFFKLEVPEIARVFNTAEVKNAITDSQQHKIDYKVFLKRIISAGCARYEVLITGKKVIYFGRDGSSHIELFPSAK